MDYIIYLFRSLYRTRWWILGITFVLTLAAIFYTRNLHGAYVVESTLYTGVVSGYSIEYEGKVDWTMAQNAMDNLINIIRAESTLKRVSIRLFARVLINGNPQKDNNGITAASYNYTYDHVKNSPHGKELLALIDKSSEEKTMENFLRYEKPEKDNYIYGLFYYQHPYYSYEALKQIQVERKGSSDLLRVSYSSGDPGIAYNTISILMEEFVYEYRLLRYGETDKVIEYFRQELERIGGKLKGEEDDLTQYNVENRIINYYDETKEIAAINKEFELREQDVLFAYNSTKAMLEELEKQMDSNTKQVINNLQLVDKLKEVSSLTGKITEMETLSTANAKGGDQLQAYKNKLSQTRKELSNLSNQYASGKFTKEGLAKANIVEQWLDQVLLFEKAKAELQIAQRSREELNEKYVFFAPVGTTIKRKERSINFTEQNYLSVLKSYNDALMRKKNLEMTSATLKVLNPPAYPINTQSTNRKKIVMIVCVGSFLALVGFFLLIEFIDRTLRDSERAHKQTGCPVLGAFPALSKPSPSNTICENKATQYMSSAILRFFNHRDDNMPYVLNILSTGEECGKSHLAEHLYNYWNNLGLKVRRLKDGTDFNSNSSQFALANSAKDYFKLGQESEDIVIVEYPALDSSNIPTSLLKDAQLNLLVAPANYGWKATDKILLQKLRSQIGKMPHLYLNYAKKFEVETYTGMLPPYTLMRRITYRLSQLALTETFFHHKKNVKNKQTQDDDE